MILRPYQTEALLETRATLTRLRADEKPMRAILHAPTGAGKTVISSAIIQSAIQKNRRVIFLAHRKELITQCSGKLDDLGVPHGIIMGAHPRSLPHLPVQVASIQTLVGRIKKKPMQADLIIIDECHRATSKSYQDVVNRFPGATVLGLTATPERSDGRGLGEIFEEIIPVSTVRALIDQGYLVPARVFAPVKPNLDGLRIVRGDYDETEMASLMDQADLVRDVVAHWQKLAAGRTTVAFAVNIRHSKHIRDSFRADGVSAEHLDGKTPDRERDAILARLASGETQVVSNVGILTEGWDLPRASCCILARPTMSTGLYQQMVGRVLRPFAGKNDALILDHAGCVHEHGLPDEPRQYSLEGVKRRRRKAGQARVLRVQTCEKCFKVFPVGLAVCDGCGWKVYVARRPPPRTDVTGQLTEVRPGSVKPSTAGRMHKELARLHAVAKSKGYKSGWVYHRMKYKYGEQLTKQVMGGRAA